MQIIIIHIAHMLHLVVIKDSFRSDCSSIYPGGVSQFIIDYSRCLDDSFVFFLYFKLREYPMQYNVLYIAKLLV